MMKIAEAVMPDKGIKGLVDFVTAGAMPGIFTKDMMEFQAAGCMHDKNIKDKKMDW